MKILLINPPPTPATLKRIGAVVNNLFANSPPLGIASLAAVMLQHGHEPAIIDAAVERLDHDLIIARVRNYHPDLIGMTCTSVSADSAYRLSRRLRSILPGTIQLLGGAHISANPLELFKCRSFDAAVLGEGEETLVELTEAMERGTVFDSIAGLAIPWKEQIRLTESRRPIPDLDRLPFPARHLLPIDLYRPQPNDQGGLPKMSMITSRGCPELCQFCDKSVFGSRYRSFSPAYVVAEMGHLVENYRVADIAFVDSNFSADVRRMRSIVTEIAKANLGVTWTCAARVDKVDRELVLAMKKAGCWKIRFGIESGDAAVLGKIDKGTDLRRIARAVKDTSDAGIRVKGFFIVGHPYDTRKSIEKSIVFARSLPLDDITVQYNTPLPNTTQHDLAARLGRFITMDRSRFSFFEPVYLPDGMNVDELKELFRSFYLLFHLRPRMLFHYVKSIHCLTDLKRLLRGLAVLIQLNRNQD